MPEYISVAKDRIKKAEKGELQMRPMDRPVYDPIAPARIAPPKTIKLKKIAPIQNQLFEKKGKYKVRKSK